MPVYNIESTAVPRCVWKIKWEIYYDADQRKEYQLPELPDMPKEDFDFIRNLNPVIYFNDLTCKHWCFDVKLPSGRWLENIRAEWANGLTFTALILI